MNSVMTLVELQRQPDSPTLAVVTLRSNADEEIIGEDMFPNKDLARVVPRDAAHWKEAGANAEVRSFFAKTSSRLVNLQISPRRTSN